MRERSTLDLAAILVTIGIFIPIMIEKFFSYLGGNFINLIPAVSLGYLCLAGFYMIIYCLVYLLEENDALIKLFLIINITLVGLVTISLGAIEFLSKLALYFKNSIVLISLGLLIGITFLVLPIVICCIVSFKLIRSRLKKR